MTDEELAEEYAEVSTNAYKDCLVDIDDIDVLKEAITEAFLEGLKAGKPKWHKVADGDLPKNNTDCIVIKEYEGVTGKYTRRKLSVYKGNNFLIWNHEYNSYVQLHNVIAWCESPKE